jgi:predicted transcriptional regulator
MARDSGEQKLGARERQIMDVIYQLGEASVGEVRDRLPNAPSYSAVRTMIRHLEGKGLLKHRQDGARYVYRPVRSRESASRSALRHLLTTFFGGSAPDAVAAILDVSADTLDAQDFKRIQQMIEQARKEGQ